MVRRPPLPAVERHPERSDAALDRGDRRGQRLPATRQQLQRQHARSAGAPRDLRAPARRAHRAQRRHHRARRQRRRRAAQLPQRRRRASGRLVVVHRSRVRPAVTLRGRARGVQVADASLSLGSGDEEGDADDRGDQAAQRPLLLSGLREAVRGRHGEPDGRPSAWHPCLRRRRRHEPRARAAVPRHGQGRRRRHPVRCRRQHLGECGLGRQRLRRRARHRARRHAHRPDRPARSLQQPLLRRRQGQPAVHDRQPVAVQRSTWRRSAP